MTSHTKISNGLNDRPIDASIAQTAEGLPDDSSSSPEVSDEEIERVRQRLVGDGRDKLLKEVAEAEKASERNSE